MSPLSAISRRLQALGLFATSAAVVVGCASIDPGVRAENAAAFQLDMQARTTETLLGRGPLTLEECTEIALENNLETRTADIGARIARIEKNAAFANFLPTVDLAYDYTSWDKQPATNVGLTYASFYDQSIGEVSLNVQLPIFMPSAWFLYEMRARGEEIGELVTEYTRQRICLRVASLYFGILGLEEADAALKSGVDAAEEIAREARALHIEGLVEEWQAKRADALVLARRIGLERTRRARQQVESELILVMGLSPMAKLNLDNGLPLADIDRPIEDLVTEALLGHVSLHIADRTIEIERATAYLALAEFLPRVFGFGSLIHTDDSFQRYSTNLVHGLSGVLSIFNGFKSVNAYKAAREREERAFLAREEESLVLILQVIRAHLQLQTARELMALAEFSVDVAGDRLREADAREAEGLLIVSKRLSILAEADAAREELLSSRFRHQVAVATLTNILGKRTFEPLESKNEE